MPQRLHRLLIPLVALLAVLPVLVQGPSCGHDFDFHVLSWLEAATQFAHLHYPHWAYTPAYNAGEPRFIFYPPISWSLGALLGLILPWKLVPAAFTFVALTASGFTARRLCSHYASAHAATLAAVLYVVNPYMLFTAYERTAYGELLAAAWLPLLLLAALAPRVRVLAIAIPVALLWLTNAPAAVMGCYALAFLTIVRLLPSNRHSGHSPEPRYLSSTAAGVLSASRSHLALTTIAATLLGLALSAFYLVPAAFERKYVLTEMATIEGMRISDNTLFHHMSPATDDTLAHDLVLHTASIIAIAMLAAIFVTFLVSLTRRNKPSLPDSLFPLPFLTLLIAILLTHESLSIWAHTPELRFLQFPWRLTAILSSIFVLFAALAFDRRKPTLRITISLALIFAAFLIVPNWRTFRQPCDDDDTVDARAALYHSNQGSEPTDEYTPADADNDVLKHPNPPYWLIPTNTQQDGAINQPAPANSQPGQAPTNLSLTVTDPEYLVLNRRLYPDERISVNSQVVHPQVRDDGLIALELPPGHDTIDLTFHHTPDQTAGLVLSCLALMASIGIQRKDRFTTNPLNSI